MGDYKRTTEQDIENILPLKEWDSITSFGRLSSLILNLNPDYGSDAEKIGILTDSLKELIFKVDNQNMIIKYLLDNITYERKELDFS